MAQFPHRCSFASFSHASRVHLYLPVLFWQMIAPRSFTKCTTIFLLAMSPPLSSMRPRCALSTRPQHALTSIVSDTCLRFPEVLTCDESTPKPTRVRNVALAMGACVATAGESFGSMSTSNAYAPQKGSRR
jgi:hypothetical protein